MIIDKEIEEFLAKEFEDKLFVEISVSKFLGEHFTLSLDYYTCRNGKVFSLEDKEYQTTDTMFNVKKDCKEIGIYDPTKIYKRVIKHYTFDEFKNIHGIQ